MEATLNPITGRIHVVASFASGHPRGPVHVLEKGTPICGQGKMRFPFGTNPDRLSLPPSGDVSQIKLRGRWVCSKCLRVVEARCKSTTRPKKGGAGGAAKRSSRSGGRTGRRRGGTNARRGTSAPSVAGRTSAKPRGTDQGAKPARKRTGWTIESAKAALLKRELTVRGYYRICDELGRVHA